MLLSFAGKLYFNGKIDLQEEGTQISSILKKSLNLPESVCMEERSLGPFVVVVAGSPNTNANVNTNTNTNANANANVNTDDEIVHSEVIFKSSNEIFVSSGSIYNRDEVLTNHLSNQIIQDDNGVMWHAWNRWGSDASLLLNGDWMYVTFNLEDSKITMARSWGHSSLYYYKCDDFLAFATQPSVIANMIGVPKEPDMNVVTKILLSKPLLSYESTWKDIYQLEPASYMEISSKETTKNIFWRPSKIVKSVDKLTEREEEKVFNEFVLLYKNAVERRIKSGEQMAGTLSAGLDSASVCALSADILGKEGRTLHTWTSVPHYKEEAVSFGRWIADETKLATATAKSRGNIIHEVTSSSNINPLELLRINIMRTGRPQSSGANMYWIEDILDKAKKANCDVVLTGQTGNSTVSWSPSQITMLPKSKFFPNTSLRKYMRFSKYKINHSLRMLMKMVFKRKNVMQNKLKLFNPQFLNCKVFESAIKEGEGIIDKTHGALCETHMSYYDIWYHISYHNGIEVRDPTMDVELTSFLLTMPENLFFLDGVDRRFIRIGMRNILAEEVRNNNRRGQQASDIVSRVKCFGGHAKKALEIISKSSLACQMLNLIYMEQVLDRVIEGETGSEIMKDCSRNFLPGLSVGLYLAQFDTDFDISKELL